MANETIQFTWPAKASTKEADIPKAFEAFRSKVAVPVETVHEMNIVGVPVTARGVAMLHSIHMSTAPLATAISEHKATPDQVINTLAPSLLALEFTKFLATNAQASKAAKTAANKEELAKHYAEGINTFIGVYGQLGMHVTEQDLIAYSKEAQLDPKAFNSLVTIANSAVAAKRTATTRQNVATGGFVATTMKLDEAQLMALVMPKLWCQNIANGSFTKHFGHSFSLQVTLGHPCIKWKTVDLGWFGSYTIPVPGWCNDTFTLAGLSYNVDLSVSYSLGCCGGSAAGHASASVCGTVIGISVCASCEASIVGAVGVSKTQNATDCTYGLGLTANLKCSFAGITVLNVSYPFGVVVHGPCPPLPC